MKTIHSHKDTEKQEANTDDYSMTTHNGPMSKGETGKKEDRNKMRTFEFFSLYNIDKTKWKPFSFSSSKHQQGLDVGVIHPRMT